MQTLYGPFRALEAAFLRHLLTNQPGLQRPVLVLCPSGRVAARLRTQLAKQNKVFSNLFFVTFSQLLATLDSELPASHKPVLPGDNLHDYILKNLLTQPGLNRYRLSRGFVSALRTSLRDMADALVNPDVLEEHLRVSTDQTLLAEEEHAQWLVRVYRAYLDKMEQIPGFRSYQTYFSEALQQAEKSPWLQHFDEIILYGFYELTGRQLDLFHVLRTHYNLTVFWLYCQEKAFEYGRRFFETNVLGVSSQSTALSFTDESSELGKTLKCLFTDQTVVQTPQGLRFVCAPGPQQELFFVMKEMLRLHEEEHIAYEDMAITARSLEPYKTLLPEMCAQNGIPLQADFSFSLAMHPLGVFLINLIGLARGGFDREDVLAVVSSPYFKHKNTWKYLIEACLAKRDFAQWQDLLRPTLPSYDPAFLHWLEQTKKQLEELEHKDSWTKLRLAAGAFLAENTTADLSAQEQEIWNKVQELLEGFERYQAASLQADEREFLDELLTALQGEQIHQATSISRGASAVDVLALRGLNFKVLFVLGLNEKIFPQLIREDPILKDYYRRILRDQLGFWINQKLERFEEERMLFSCTMQAATDKLYGSFLRNDAEGKPLIPSSYMVELARAANTDLSRENIAWIDLHLTSQLQHEKFSYLTPKEVSLLLTNNQAEETTYQMAGLLEPGEKEILQAAKQLAKPGALTERDGLISSGEEIFATQNKKGFSPSALQDLGHCPMKYFLAKGIGLREQDEALSRSELAPNLRGETYHKVLMDYYQKLLDDGLTGQLFDSALQTRLEEALSAHYTKQSYKEFGIYPVIWDLILTDIHDKLIIFVQEDAKQLEGYIPSLFEKRFEGYYAPTEEIKLKLQGIIDRIDIHPENKTFRVLDYKSSRRGGENLAAYMFKKVILQPFLYLILAQQMPPTATLTPAGAALLNINIGYGRQELTATDFEKIKQRAADFFVFLMQILKQGRFFIRPGEHCQYCPYAGICRKNSFACLLRAKHDSWTARLEEQEQQ